MTKFIISTPARLHLGFINLDSNKNRDFGSVGLTIDTFRTIIEAEESDKFQIIGKNTKKAYSILDMFTKKYTLKPCKLNIKNCIPEHIGLGSGTQLALSIATMLFKISNKKLHIENFAKIAKRGNRSSIGINCFKFGGFFVDAGRKRNSNKLSPIIFRELWPKSWKILLVNDVDNQGLFGDKENKEFKKIGNKSKPTRSQNCEALITNILPAIIEKDFDMFCMGIQIIQNNTAERFLGAQGGMFTSNKIGQIFNVLEKNGIKGYGQSSWGPTSFIFCKNKSHRDETLKIIESEIERFRFPKLKIFNVEGQNTGFKINKIGK